jgi:hypothetical protein
MSRFLLEKRRSIGSSLLKFSSALCGAVGFGNPEAVMEGVCSLVRNLRQNESYILLFSGELYLWLRNRLQWCVRRFCSCGKVTSSAGV